MATTMIATTTSSAALGLHFIGGILIGLLMGVAIAVYVFKSIAHMYDDEGR